MNFLILGNGLLAKACVSFFKYDEEIIIFASGVSNSKEKKLEEFSRERSMLINALSKNKFIVYFSTCSIEDPELNDTPYVKHKVAMEAEVRRAKNYLIFRLPQVVGHTKNPNTLTNYLYGKIVSGSFFHVWGKAKRNLIDVDDVAKIAYFILKNKGVMNETLNIVSPVSFFIVDLVNIFESILNKKANYEVLDIGGNYSINNCIEIHDAMDAGVIFNDLYAEKILRKYYEKRL